MEKRVFIAKCSDYEQSAAAVNRVLEAFGGATAILNGRKRVLVKPNLLVPKKPEDAATTHPAVVEAVCTAFMKAGAKVELIDSTASPHNKMILRLLYNTSGLKAMAKKSGAKLSFDTSSKVVDFPEGRNLKEYPLLSPVLDAELVVSVAKAKTHGFMAMTGCVKNMFGCVPGLNKPRLHRRNPKHEDFAAALVDICLRVAPGFSILDAVYGMEGAGPSGGDPKYIGAIAGGISPFAVDLAQCHLMGFRAENIYTIAEAASRGLAPENPEVLDWLGDDPEPLKTNFKPAVKHKRNAAPVIMDKCVGCGDCARVCPMSCIEIQDGKAVINREECIRCFCCHEFCLVKAISLG